MGGSFITSIELQLGTPLLLLRPYSQQSRAIYGYGSLNDFPTGVNVGELAMETLSVLQSC